MPIISLNKNFHLKDLIKKEIFEYDLFLYNNEESSIINNELLASPRIDNLSCTYAGLNAFLKEKGISRNKTTNTQTKEWNIKKHQKDIKKTSKTIEKVIEKEAEKEAQQIVDIKSIANDLALNIIKANSQLETYLVKNKKKTKKVKYDYKANKPSEEEIIENEEIETMRGIIDRQGLKMLASALKDLNEIIGNDKEANKETLDKLDEVLKGLGGVV